MIKHSVQVLKVLHAQDFSDSYAAKTVLRCMRYHGKAMSELPHELYLDLKDAAELAVRRNATAEERQNLEDWVYMALGEQIRQWRWLGRPRDHTEWVKAERMKLDEGERYDE